MEKKVTDNANVNETNDDVVISPLKPLTGEPVNVKSYSKLNVKGGDNGTANESIPEPEEPTFTPPPIADGVEGEHEVPPVMPHINNLPPKEKKNAAAQAVTMVIGGYELLHTAGNNALKISDRKLRNLSRKNLIDLRTPIQTEGGVMPMSGFINLYNEESSDTFTVSDTFKEEIRPPLERVFEKRGIGASDEEMIMYIVAKDLAFKVPRFIQMFQIKSDMLNQLIDVTEAYRKGPINYSNPNPQQQQQQQQQPTNNNTYKPPYTQPPPPPPSYNTHTNDEEHIPFSDVIIQETIPEIHENSEDNVIDYSGAGASEISTDLIVSASPISTIPEENESDGINEEINEETKSGKQKKSKQRNRLNPDVFNREEEN